MSEHACTSPALSARFKVQLADNRQPQTDQRHDFQTHTRQVLYSFTHLKAALTFFPGDAVPPSAAVNTRVDASTDDVSPHRNPDQEERNISVLNKYSLSHRGIRSQRKKYLRKKGGGSRKCSNLLLSSAALKIPFFNFLHISSRFFCFSPIFKAGPQFSRCSAG